MMWSGVLFLGSMVGVLIWYHYKTLYIRLVTDYLKHTANEVIYKNIVGMTANKIVDFQYIHNSLMKMNVGDAIFTFSKLIREFAASKESGNQLSENKGD
jgi:hypothetical protein